MEAALVGEHASHQSARLGGACLTDWPYDTDEWRRVSRAARRRDGRRCTCCDVAGHRLDVHHVQPIHSGGEAFSLDNLTSVCRPCHRAVHRELYSLSADDRQSWQACDDAFRRVCARRRAQPRWVQLRLPFDASADPMPPARGWAAGQRVGGRSCARHATIRPMATAEGDIKGAELTSRLPAAEVAGWMAGGAVPVARQSG